MTGITASFRFPGGTHHSLRHFATTLVPFPRLHYLIPSYAPLTARAIQPYRALNVPELISEVFSTNSMLTPCDVRNGKYIATSLLLRGCTSPAEVVNYLNLTHSKKSQYYASWLPQDIQIGFCDIPPRGLPMSATVLGKFSNSDTLSNAENTSVFIRLLPCGSIRNFCSQFLFNNVHVESHPNRLQ